MQDAPHDRITQTAQALGLIVPPECRDGVQANLDLLAHHARVLDALPLDDLHG